MYCSTLSLTSALDGVGGQRHALAALPPGKPGTNCIRGWVGPRTGLDGWGKSCPHRDSIPRPSSPYRVAIPTELSLPTYTSLTQLLNHKIKQISITMWKKRWQNLSVISKTCHPQEAAWVTCALGPISSHTQCNPRRLRVSLVDCVQSLYIQHPPPTRAQVSLVDSA